MNFTQNHNSMNIYCKSMWLLLLPFRYKFRNARLHLGKCHSHIIFATKSVPFLSFHVYHPRKGLLAKIRCNKRCEYLKGFLSNKRVWYDLVTPKRWERCRSEELLLKLALLKFNDFVEVFIVDICCRNTKRERLSHPCWIWLSGGEVSVERLCELIWLSSPWIQRALCSCISHLHAALGSVPLVLPVLD